MNLKEAKANFFIDTAIELFIKKSINEVTIRDIALKAGVGEATLYRYFTKKQNIVAAAVMKLQGIVDQSYFHLEQGQNGFEKISIFYNSYLQMFCKEPTFYKFIKEFDSYMANEDNELLETYGNELNKYKESYLNAYNLGLKDGSIKKQKDIDILYFTSTHAIIELCKKLASEQIVIAQDVNTNQAKEVECLIDVFLNQLKNS